MISGKFATAFLACLFLFQADDLDALKRRYESDRGKEAKDRTATVVEIGKLKSDEAAEFLIKISDREVDRTVRRAVFQALGACGTPNAMKHLLSVSGLASVADEVRSWALDSAMSVGFEEAVTLASAILAGRKESNTLRELAARSLHKYVPIERSEKTWRKALNDEVADIRALSLLAMAPLKDSQVLTLAKTALLDSKHAAEVRHAAVEPWRLKGGPAAVRLFLDVPIGNDGVLRAALEAALSKIMDEPSFDALIVEIPKATPEMRAVAAWALGKSKHLKSVHVLQKMFADPDVAVRIAALEAAAERGSDEVCEILKTAAQKGEDETSEAAVGLLSKFPYPATVDLLVRLAAKAGRITYRVAAIDALSRIGAAEAFAPFSEGLRAREWPILAASIRGLSRIRRRESVDLLIERMTMAEGRLLGDLAAALNALTGKSLGYNPEHWKAWWQVNREKFAFDDASRRPEGAVGGGGTTTYHDIPVLSKQVIFLLDISGSMNMAKGKSTRIAEAKAELAKVLKALPKEARVNLIFFNSQVDAWQNRLMPLGQNLAKALAKVESLNAGGSTNIHDSIEKALADPDVDTMYLLSDGAPSAGKFTVAGDVLREVRRMNRMKQVAIHTISLGKSEFMKQLAAENCGQYQEVK